MAGSDAHDAAPRTALRRAILSALVISLLLAPLPWVDTWRLEESRLFDLMSTLWPARPPTPSAVIVAIDEPSFAEIGQQWPWPRALHGRLIEALRGAGARVIALDIIFAEPAADPDQDRQLVERMGPDIVLAGDETVIETAQAVQRLRTEPLPALLRHGGHVGIASVALDGDTVLRRLPTAPDTFARLLAGLAGADATRPRGDALIQYFGRPGSYPTVSYYQALDPAGHLPPGFFRGTTVIVGLSLQNTATVGAPRPENFATSYTITTGLLASGPEVQATILDNIIHDLSIRPLPPWIAAALAVVATWLAALATYAVHPWRAAATAIGGFLGFLGGSYLMLRFGRVWLPPLLPLAGTVLAVAIEIGQGYLTERAARRRITTAFGHYLAPSLVEQLARDPRKLKLGGERRRLTLLFCDIRGFTTISERLKDDPERLTSLVNRVLTSLSEAVLQAGGTIDKYIGDCIMAFWNAPIEDPEHALHGVEAAVAMHRAIDRLNAELAAEAVRDQRAPVAVAVGIGINTGDCVVGNMGSERRFNYSALGDAVNLAARLESLCKTYDVGVVLGEATERELAGRIATRRLDAVIVKGRSEAVTIYALA